MNKITPKYGAGDTLWLIERRGGDMTREKVVVVEPKVYSWGVEYVVICEAPEYDGDDCLRGVDEKVLRRTR